MSSQGLAPRGYCDDCMHPRAAHFPLRWNANTDPQTRVFRPDWRAPGCIVPDCGCPATWADRAASSKSSRDQADEPLPPHPAPEVACRQANPGEIPRAAVQMHKAARENGWTAAVTYARGTQVDRQGRVAQRTERVLEDSPESDQQWRNVPVGPLVVDSIAVRFSRAGAQGFAIWIDGAFSVALVRDEQGPRRLKSREALAYLREPLHMNEEKPCSAAA